MHGGACEARSAPSSTMSLRWSARLSFFTSFAASEVSGICFHTSRKSGSPCLTWYTGWLMLVLSSPPIAAPAGRLRARRELDEPRQRGYLGPDKFSSFKFESKFASQVKSSQVDLTLLDILQVLTEVFSGLLGRPAALFALRHRMTTSLAHSFMGSGVYWGFGVGQSFESRMAVYWCHPLKARCRQC